MCLAGTITGTPAHSLVSVENTVYAPYRPWLDEMRPRFLLLLWWLLLLDLLLELLWLWKVDWEPVEGEGWWPHGVGRNFNLRMLESSHH